MVFCLTANHSRAKSISQWARVFEKWTIWHSYVSKKVSFSRSIYGDFLRDKSWAFLHYDRGILKRTGSSAYIRTNNRRDSDEHWSRARWALWCRRNFSHSCHHLHITCRKRPIILFLIDLRILFSLIFYHLYFYTHFMAWFKVISNFK